MKKLKDEKAHVLVIVMGLMVLFLTLLASITLTVNYSGKKEVTKAYLDAYRIDSENKMYDFLSYLKEAKDSNPDMNMNNIMIFNDAKKKFNKKYGYIYATKEVTIDGEKYKFIVKEDNECLDLISGNDHYYVKEDLKKYKVTLDDENIPVSIEDAGTEVVAIDIGENNQPIPIPYIAGAKIKSRNFVLDYYCLDNDNLIYEITVKSSKVFATRKREQDTEEKRLMLYLEVDFDDDYCYTINKKSFVDEWKVKEN